MPDEMERALKADGEKLRALTGEDHGPYEIPPMTEAELLRGLEDLGLVAPPTERHQPKRGDLWKHYKGGLYWIDAIGKDEPTLTPVVVYRAVKDDHVWVRTLENFMGWGDVETGVAYRFELVR